MKKRTILSVPLLLFACLGLSAQIPQAKDSVRLSLEDMYAMLDEDNSSMIMLRYAEEAAREGETAARRSRLPDVSASASVSYIGDAFSTDRDFSNYTRLSSPHFGNSFALDASLLVYGGGAIDASVDLAELAVKAAEADTQKARISLRFMVTGSVLDLYKLANSERVYESNIALTESLIEEVKARAEQGIVLRNDITRYELRLEGLRLALTNIRNTQAILNYRLCNSLGLPEGSYIVTEPRFPADSEESLAELQDLAYSNSPELRKADISAEMAGQQERLVRSDRLPKVAIVASESFNGPITFELPPVDQNLNVWYVGLGISYDLGSLWKGKRKVSEARKNAEAARQAVAVTEENLRNDVFEAYTDYLQSFVNLQTQRKSVQLAGENYATINDRYMEGLALATEMTDAFNVKLDAELAEADALADIAYSYYKMHYIAGIL